MGLLILYFCLVKHGQFGVVDQIVNLIKTQYYVLADISDLKSPQMLILLSRILPNRQPFPHLKLHLITCIYQLLPTFALKIWM